MCVPSGGASRKVISSSKSKTITTETKDVKQVDGVKVDTTKVVNTIVKTLNVDRSSSKAVKTKTTGSGSSDSESKNVRRIGK